ncbi:hypothetical protein BJV78DRAFT_536188 [Lactifluus subvellereus]|nr:hypothetical protein BJV78DRAFT_536188 [Lactifluus subvellereus]
MNNKKNSVVSVNERDFEISVFSTHTFDDDKTEITLPSAIDSRLISSILFTFSGTVDHSTPILPTDMLRSSAVQSFLLYLTIASYPEHMNFPSSTDFALSKNKDHLGIIDISEVILDDHSSGIPKVSVTPSRYPSFHPSADVHVLSIHLAYNWKSLSQLSSGPTIFSPQILLPLRPALNKLVRKLFSIHVVGCYPWLFGPLRTKLDLEYQWFPSLVRSLQAITGRSENQVFRNKIQALVKKIQNQVSVYKQK